MSKLNENEFKEVTKTFINRLSNEMSTAGCNDLDDDEFPTTVCEKFDSDFELLYEWSSMIVKQKELKDEK